ncbi:hypothetical protein IWX83_003242 [Flavobacterium sp. CG_9.1]|uniref:Uncharacterized protein n=1 Tax=Flavobacterium xanthum TaxID=69322 RepID=A0A1M7JRK7_9FLAO|nr:hypothetical protein [Flavobacterium sp. CG_9.1]SHM55535.1 hypothetical protein SAMN05443669_10452 [Flavobacterium xanthum]
MKKYLPLSDSSSRKPVKIMRIFILIAFIVFGIFHLGKDCANYDKRHAASLNKTR